MWLLIKDTQNPESIFRFHLWVKNRFLEEIRKGWEEKFSPLDLPFFTLGEKKCHAGFYFSVCANFKIGSASWASNFEKGKSFLPKSFSDAPTWYTSFWPMIRKRSWLLFNGMSWKFPNCSFAFFKSLAIVYQMTLKGCLQELHFSF